MKKGLYLLIATVVLAAGISSYAFATGENNPVKGGARNPSSNPSLSYTKETEIIANNTGYGTRQSNKGSGGGAIYGCRATAATIACLRAANISTGQAFQVATNGPLGGSITAIGGDNAKPFTTNATGVATGLNADRLDSLHAADIVAQARALSPFAKVAQDGTLLAASAGVTSKHGNTGSAGDGNYTVVFASDVSKCSITATENELTDSGAIGVELAADGKTLSVRTRSGGGTDGTGATIPTDRPFSVTAQC